MEIFNQIINIEYSKVIEDGVNKIEDIQKKIETINSKLLNHIYKLDPDLLAIKDNLLIALRLTECLKSFNWIQSCLILGSYRASYRELRFMIESVCQAFYIDYNHFKESLGIKFIILKALGDFGNFIGKNLFDKIKINKNLKEKIKQIYGTLSKYIHPSFEEAESLLKIKISSVDNNKELYENTFNLERLEEILELCEEVSDLLIDLNRNFEEKFHSLLQYY